MISLLLSLAVSASAQHTGQMSPTSDVSGNRVKATGSTTPRALRDRFSDVVNVRDFGAVGDYNPTGDTGTDDTAAFQAAITQAQTTGAHVFIPAGKYLITNTLQIANSVSIQGVRRPGGDGTSANVRGAQLFYRNATATVPAIRLSAAGYVLTAVTFSDIEIRHVSQVANQHSVVIDGSNFSSFTMERVTFWSMTGYAIYFKGNVYGQNLRFSDLSFFSVGGLFGREAGTSVDGLDVTLAEVHNINLESNINQISPQSPAVDFSLWREVRISNLLLEGGTANQSAGGVGVLLGGNAYTELDGFHEEFSSQGFTNGIVITDPQYGGQPMGLFDLRNLETGSPVRVSAALAQVHMTGVSYWGNPGGSLAGVVTVDPGSKANVVIDGLQTAWLVNGKSALKDVHRISVRNVAGMYGTENNRASWDDTFEVYRWTARDGDPALRANGVVTIYPEPATITTSQLVTDATEGRVWQYSGVGDAMPKIDVKVSPTAAWTGAQIIAAIRYKAVSAADGYVQMLFPSSEGGTWSGPDTYGTGSAGWATAYALIADYTDDGLVTFYSRSVGVTAPSPWTVYVAELRVLVGRSLPRLIGTVGSSEPIAGRGTAAPTLGTYIAGDKVWNTAPAAGGAPGWVCATGGSPGTWKAMANLAP